MDHKNAPMDPDETLRMESIPNLLLSSLGIHSAQKNKRLFVKPETNINTQSASHKNLQVCEEANSLKTLHGMDSIAAYKTVWN